MQPCQPCPAPDTCPASPADMAIWRAVRPVPSDWPEVYATYGGLGKVLITSVLKDGEMAWQAFSPWPADQLHVIGGEQWPLQPGVRPWARHAEDQAEAAGEAGPARELMHGTQCRERRLLPCVLPAANNSSNPHGACLAHAHRSPLPPVPACHPRRTPRLHPQRCQQRRAGGA